MTLAAEMAGEACQSNARDGAHRNGALARIAAQGLNRTPKKIPYAIKGQVQARHSIFSF
jgi:hypothetical protein